TAHRRNIDGVSWWCDMDETQSKLFAAVCPGETSMIFGTHGCSCVNYVGECEAATKLLTASLATFWLGAESRAHSHSRKAISASLVSSTMPAMCGPMELVSS